MEIGVNAECYLNNSAILPMLSAGIGIDFGDFTIDSSYAYGIFARKESIEFHLEEIPYFPLDIFIAAGVFRQDRYELKSNSYVELGFIKKENPRKKYDRFAPRTRFGLFFPDNYKNLKTSLQSPGVTLSMGLWF